VVAADGVIEFGGGSVAGGRPEVESGVEPAVDAVAGDDVVDDEVSVDVVDPESAGSANAVAGEVTTAIPTPSANARGPIRPMKSACLTQVPRTAVHRPTATV